MHRVPIIFFSLGSDFGSGCKYFKSSDSGTGFFHDPVPNHALQVSFQLGSGS